MAIIKGLIILFQLLMVHAYSLTHQKPVTEVEWRGRCLRNAVALNDCNWCRCNDQHKFICEARTCAFVDMFGHFNDAIRDIDVGMEGKGSWRSTALACEPGVQYRRSGLLCVCTDDGAWPNPVCRDIFRVLHSVEHTGDSEVTGQKCSPTKLYLIGCNVCFCPSSGQLDANLCTNKICAKDDPVMKSKKDEDIVDPNQLDEEIYAECNVNHQYKLGCKTCSCLRNNRLHCGNCTFNQEESIKSFCSHVVPSQTFNIGCNLCYCDEKGFAYCSTKKCLLRQSKGLTKQFTKELTRGLTKPKVESSEPFNEETCVPGKSHFDGCNTCFCDLRGGKKVFTCTVKKCARSENPQLSIHIDCVNGTTYELNCFICQCGEVDGVKTQICWMNTECTSKNVIKETRSHDLDSLHGYCEPLHMYKRGCNTCRCLSDGKTVRCSSYECNDAPQPVSVEIVPVAQDGDPCPKGSSYKIQCNYCFCLSNGNALCTTHDCRYKRN